MAAALSAFFLAVSLLLFSPPPVDAKGNPSEDLVTALNSNRTAHKSTSLAENPGLGCLALQYIKAYKGQCKDVGSDSRRPALSEFPSTFAPNCGVNASTLGPITGRIIACQTKYVEPEEAFSILLAKTSRSLDIMQSNNHTQVGAALTGTDGGSPYFWCFLFSNGHAKDTFVLDGGKPKKVVGSGCFSGANEDCSAAAVFQPMVWAVPVIVVASAAYIFGK